MKPNAWHLGSGIVVFRTSTGRLTVGNIRSESVRPADAHIKAIVKQGK